MEQRLTALVIFAAVYACFIAMPARRSWTALIGAVLVLLTGVLTPKEALLAVNWNVMGVFCGMLALADLFTASRVPAYVAVKIVNRSQSACAAICFICALTGVISAFVDNIATFMIVAPIAFSVARKLNMNPMKPLMAIAVSSNLQGAATLIGDPPSMLLAGFAGLNFTDFFFFMGRPGLFFAVQVGALASFVFLYWIFRKERQATAPAPEEKVRTWFPSVLLIVLIAGLTVSSFVDPDFSYLAGGLCTTGALVGAAWDLRVNRGSFLGRIMTLDWSTAFFLAGVFVLVGAVTATNWTQTLAAAVASYIGDNVLLGFIVIILVSMSVSSLVDNVPFLAAMLPVVILVSDKLEMNSAVFLFGLVLGTCLGGNITPVGAGANIVCVGLLRKEGYDVRFRDFVKIGLPFSIVSVSAAAIFVWLVWAP